MLMPHEYFNLFKDIKDKLKREGELFPPYPRQTFNWMLRVIGLGFGSHLYNSANHYLCDLMVGGITLRRCWWDRDTWTFGLQLSACVHK